MAAVLKYKVLPQDDGKTVEKLLKKEYGISSGLMKELKLNGKLQLNGKACRSIDAAKANDLICADVSEFIDCCSVFKPCMLPLDIIFEDDFIIVVNKQGGMASHPCPSNRESTLANGLMYYWGQKREYHNYHIVNRLDKDTSGVCVIAKNRFAHGCLARQMKEGLFEKEYLAIVHGNLNPVEGTIEIPIKREEGSVIKREASTSGKYAKTTYNLVAASKDKRFSLVNLKLETGRTHQIRVHLSYIGFPLVGDWLYGNGDNERDLIKRHALHAKSISFFHPVTKEKLCFDADIPNEMKKLINLF